MSHKWRLAFVLIVAFLLVVTFFVIHSTDSYEVDETNDNVVEEVIELVVDDEGESEDTLAVYTHNDLSFDYPVDWEIKTGRAGDAVAFYEKDEIKAELICPIMETGYEVWDFEKSERTFEKEGVIYGTELWFGTPLFDEDSAMVLIFMHRNAWPHWGGDNDVDVASACQLRLMADSVTDLDELEKEAKEIWQSVR